MEKDIRFEERSALMVDSTFFDVFQLPMVRGDGKKALKSPNAILLLESAAKKYFGDDDPLNDSTQHRPLSRAAGNVILF